MAFTEHAGLSGRSASGLKRKLEKQLGLFTGAKNQPSSIKSALWLLPFRPHGKLNSHTPAIPGLSLLC